MVSPHERLQYLQQFLGPVVEAIHVNLQLPDGVMAVVSGLGCIEAVCKDLDPAGSGEQDHPIVLILRTLWADIDTMFRHWANNQTIMVAVCCCLATALRTLEKLFAEFLPNLLGDATFEGPLISSFRLSGW